MHLTLLWIFVGRFERQVHWVFLARSHSPNRMSKLLEAQAWAASSRKAPRRHGGFAGPRIPPARCRSPRLPLSTDAWRL